MVAKKKTLEGAFDLTLEALNNLDEVLRLRDEELSSDVNEALSRVASGLTSLLIYGPYNSPAGELVHYHRDRDPRSSAGGGFIKVIDPSIRIQLQMLDEGQLHAPGLGTEEV